MCWIVLAFNNMLGLRVTWFLNKILTVFFYKVCYGRRLTLPLSTKIRFGFRMVIDNDNATVKIGKGCFFNNNCSINALCGFEIGDNVLFGENVKVYDHNHKYSNPDVPIANQGFSSAPIRIGSNCWIGSNVVILKGVTIGEHCVIGAGCIIYKDVPAYTVLINKQAVICLHN